jgi:hypothetical protein
MTRVGNRSCHPANDLRTYLHAGQMVYSGNDNTTVDARAMMGPYRCVSALLDLLLDGAE